MPITAFYAGLLAPLFVVLSIRVIGVRRREKIALGDGGNASLMRSMRVHANFAEYVPLALLLLLLAESVRTPGWLLHSLGVALVAARYVHAYGVSRSHENFKLRVFGMATTFSVLLIASLACLIGAILPWLAGK